MDPTFNVPSLNLCTLYSIHADGQRSFFRDGHADVTGGRLHHEVVRAGIKALAGVIRVARVLLRMGAINLVAVLVQHVIDHRVAGRILQAEVDVRGARLGELVEHVVRRCTVIGTFVVVPVLRRVHAVAVSEGVVVSPHVDGCLQAYLPI